jgi:hypothetical protein
VFVGQHNLVLGPKIISVFIPHQTKIEIKNSLYNSAVCVVENLKMPLIENHRISHLIKIYFVCDEMLLNDLILNYTYQSSF